MRQAFLQVLGVFLCQYHSTNVPYSAFLSGYLHNAVTKRPIGRSLENLPESNALSVNGEGGGTTVQKHTFTFYSSLQVLKGEHIPKFQS